MPKPNLAQYIMAITLQQLNMTQLSILETKLKQLKRDLAVCKRKVYLGNMRVTNMRRIRQIENEIFFTEKRIYNLKRITNVS